MRINYHARAWLTAVLFFAATHFGARAQDNPVIYRDVETKYVFGFTEGSGIGLEGEKEFSPETFVSFGKRDGRYRASETKLEYEFTPNQYVQFELGPMVAWHDINGVTDLDDRNQVAFSGLFGEIRYLVLDRGPSSPLAVTLSAEPEWHRIDETSGQRVTNFGLELKVNADLELVKNRLYFASNLLYEPEGTHDPDGVGAGWEIEFDRRHLGRVVLSHHPVGFRRRRGLVSAPLRGRLVQQLYRGCGLRRTDIVCPDRAQDIHDRGFQYAGGWP